MMQSLSRCQMRVVFLFLVFLKNTRIITPQREYPLWFVPTLRLVQNQQVVVSQVMMKASQINTKSTSHVGSVIKLFASMISIIHKTQSSTKQRVRTKMLLRSSLKCSWRKSRVFIRNSTLPWRWSSQMKIGRNSKKQSDAGFASVHLTMKNTALRLSKSLTKTALQPSWKQTKWGTTAISGKYYGAVHYKGNLPFKKPKFTPVIFHNLANYDSHLFVKNLSKSKGNNQRISNNEEKYISLTTMLLLQISEIKKEKKWK